MAQIQIHPAEEAPAANDAPYFGYSQPGEVPAAEQVEFVESAAQVYESDKENNYYSSEEENLLSDKEREREAPK